MKRWSLPLSWAVAAAILLWPMLAFPPDATLGDHATYYFVAHRRLGLSFTAWAAICAAGYTVLAGAKVSYRTALAWVHLFLTLSGVALILLPTTLLRIAKTPRGDIAASFATLTFMASVGYLIVLASLAVFAALLTATALAVIQKRVAGEP
jgi:hypothetical protein